MTGSTARIFLNLAALRRGGGLTHVSGFLPELVAMRPGDYFAAVAPAETADLVASWGISVNAHDAAPGSPRLRFQLDQATTRLGARRSNILLSPLNHGPINASVPQILWACNTLYFRAARTVPEAVNATLARAAMRRADLVVYPTAGARVAAERSGVTPPGLILRHPLRTATSSSPARGWTQVDSGPLRVLVPSSHQPHKNLALLRRLSTVLADRGVDHHIQVTAHLPAALTSGNISGGFTYDHRTMSSLHDQFDAVVIPSLAESYSYPLVEFERLGFPVAASSIDVHQELGNRARLFDPASPHGAADALMAAVADGPTASPAGGDDWRFNSPGRYAAAVSAEIDRMLGRRAP